MFQFGKFVKKENNKIYWEIEQYRDIQKIIKYCWLNKMYNIDLTMNFKSEKYILALPYSMFYDHRSFIAGSKYWFSMHVYKKQLMMC